MGKLLPSWKYALTVVICAGSMALLIGLRPHVDLTTVASLLLVVVIIIATWAGRGPALLASLLVLVSFNFFFIPPVHTLRIHESQDWIAFAAFLFAAITVGWLSSAARERAEEAERHRAKAEQLYKALQEAFEQASQAETLRRSEKLKTALLDAVTHDLKTPLTSIKASVTSLLSTQAEGASSEREYLQVINEETDRLDHFVEEMMALAQIEGGHLLLHPRPTSAEEVISNAVARADKRLQGAQVQITVPDTLPMLEVDAATISQALYEIVENAAKYCGPARRIAISAVQRDATVEIAVENDGMPVPEELRTRVFEKLFRVPGTSKKDKGFGLGLAIARGIVEAHGGRITMEATPENRGTVVRFTVPVRIER
ncbi:MAG TPA: DUF4118 domain-containing protein [Terriglobales bacterium]|nr:DUF4118 domain-containing protein [Terriglobales bacterium]